MALSECRNTLHVCEVFLGHKYTLVRSYQPPFSPQSASTHDDSLKIEHCYVIFSARWVVRHV